VDGAWEFLSTRADRTGVSFCPQIDPDLQVTVQRTRMQRVFMNLFANSIEAMPHGGVISVNASRESRFVVVRIEDNGCGIPSDVREKLFEPFVSGARKNGMGLGLALARQTVADSGGELWLDSGLASGARFCLRLPAAGADVEGDASTDANRVVREM
jgi:signal transduction histidine kinase